LGVPNIRSFLRKFKKKGIGQLQASTIFQIIYMDIKMNYKRTFAALSLLAMSCQLLAFPQQDSDYNSYKTSGGATYAPQTVFTSCSGFAPAGYVLAAVVINTACAGVGRPFPPLGYRFSTYVDQPIGAVLSECENRVPLGWALTGTGPSPVNGICTGAGSLHNTFYYNIKRVS
jgi:hypothetical protein